MTCNGMQLLLYKCRNIIPMWIKYKNQYNISLFFYGTCNAVS